MPFIQAQYATVFNSNLKGSDKLTIKNCSFSRKLTDGTFENESWTCRFSGKAKEVIDSVPEKTRVRLTGDCHTGYDKETKKSYPYIWVTKVEVVEPKEGGSAAPTTEKASAPSDDDLPDVDW